MGWADGAEHPRVKLGDVVHSNDCVEQEPQQDDGGEGIAHPARAKALNAEQNDQDGNGDAHNGACRGQWLARELEVAFCWSVLAARSGRPDPELNEQISTFHVQEEGGRHLECSAAENTVDDCIQQVSSEFSKQCYLLSLLGT